MQEQISRAEIAGGAARGAERSHHVDGRRERLAREELGRRLLRRELLQDAQESQEPVL